MRSIAQSAKNRYQHWKGRGSRVVGKLGHIPKFDLSFRRLTLCSWFKDSSTNLADCYKSYLKEVFQTSEGNVEAVEESIKEKEDEKLVVVERHTVVHPSTVVVHLHKQQDHVFSFKSWLSYLEDTSAAYRAMMRSVRLDCCTFLTVSHLEWLLCCLKFLRNWMVSTADCVFWGSLCCKG